MLTGFLINALTFVMVVRKSWCSSSLLKTMVTFGSSCTKAIRFIDGIKISPDYFDQMFLFSYWELYS